MIAARQLTLKAGNRTLIANLDWRARASECWCIVGKNGAGKSSLLHALAGLRQPDAGSVSLGETGLRDLSPLEQARRRALLPQTHSDAFGFRVIDAVLMARFPGGVARQKRWRPEWRMDTGQEDLAAVHAALGEVDALHLIDRDLRVLSGGERQRVALAAVFAQGVPLLLLDEPTTALDLAHQASLAATLRRQRREHGKTIVLAGHDLTLMAGIATHALLLMDGGQWLAGDAATIFRPDLIEECLGYPVDELHHQGRRIFVPAAR